MSDFNNPTKISELAKKIIPDPPASASDEQKAAITEARQNLEDKFLTELGDFINTGLNNIFTAGVPAPGDGGAALQTAWKAQTT